MKIDLHIHSSCSDGRMSPEELFQEARQRGLGTLSITDHDSLDCQEQAEILAEKYGIHYIRGLELSVSFSHPDYKGGKPISLDFLAYEYDLNAHALMDKLADLRKHRVTRGEQILEKLNQELSRQNAERLTHKDLDKIKSSVGGSFGRPHIAAYLVKRGFVNTVQEAFDRYLVKCNVPKMPLSLSEASRLVKEAGGKLMLAHPNDPRGTSLISFTSSIDEQQRIIKESMLRHVDGIECWHSRHDPQTTASYLSFARECNLMVTGGSDCHQAPVVMGTVDVPAYIIAQFGGEYPQAHQEH
ncbi:MAG: PHP domain-containing protein [Deltaproteobacteria bacterium]|nr:PHP domain-containing protein [Deltaproteobacteria bacterium]